MTPCLGLPAILDLVTTAMHVTGQDLVIGPPIDTMIEPRNTVMVARDEHRVNPVQTTQPFRQTGTGSAIHCRGIHPEGHARFWMHRADPVEAAYLETSAEEVAEEDVGGATIVVTGAGIGILTSEIGAIQLTEMNVVGNGSVTGVIETAKAFEVGARHRGEGRPLDEISGILEMHL